MVTGVQTCALPIFPYAVKDGIFTVNSENCASTWSGPVNLMTLSSTSPDYMWGMSSDRVSYINVKDGKFERIVEAELPDIKKHTKEELEKLTADYSSLNDLNQAATDILGQMRTDATFCATRTIMYISMLEESCLDIVSRTPPSLRKESCWTTR